MRTIAFFVAVLGCWQLALAQTPPPPAKRLPPAGIAIDASDIAAILEKLPLEWTGQELRFGGRTYDASRHMLILIFPNPANPRRYVVLNSGLDFREDAYGTNAKQTPKLPDWAIVDLDVPPGPRWPGRIAAAGFFDERWNWTEQTTQ